MKFYLLIKLLLNLFLLNKLILIMLILLIKLKILITVLDLGLNSHYGDLICSAIPLKTYKNLSQFPKIENLRKDLYKKGGVYALVHLPDGKQYLGSSLNLYERLSDHLKGVSSNIRLQRTITKSGIDNFIFVIYYFHTDPKVILTDVETKFILSFPFEELYNFKKEAKSMLGYKHTNEALEKMKNRLKNKKNHPMFGS